MQTKIQSAAKCRTTDSISVHKRIIRKIVITVIWLLIWQFVSILVGQEILFVSPVRVARELIVLFGTANFWLSSLLSLIRVTAGYLIGVVSAFCAAYFSHKYRFLHDFLRPALSVISATPVASFIMLAYLWFDNHGNITVFICFLMAFPIIWGNTFKGLDQVDSGLVEMGRVFGFGRMKMFIKIILPSIMPYFISSAITSLSLAWKAGIAAEVICRPEMSIGKMIYESKLYIETPALFAWTASVIILSVIVKKVFMYLGKVFLKKYNFNGEQYAD